METQKSYEKKRKIFFTIIFKEKEIRISIKSFIEWVVLLLLVVSIPAGIYLNFFAFEYRYFKCGMTWPLELRGSYYRLPGDEGYGIHSNSDYGYCTFERPQGTVRDPTTAEGAEMVAKRATQEVMSKDFSSSALGFVLYVPKTYAISPIGDTHNISKENLQINYTVATNDGLEFKARVMKKDSDFSYTNLCSKPAEENWSGVVIGKDKKGREICKTNLSKYIKDYIVGINIGDTAIMLQTKLGKISEQALTVEVANIFSSMEAYSKSSKNLNFTEESNSTNEQNNVTSEKQQQGIINDKPFSKHVVY